MNGFNKALRRTRTVRFAATGGTLALLLGLLLVLLAAAGAPTARAQQPPPPGSAPDPADAAKAQKVQQLLEQRANRQAKDLGLTQDQTNKLVKINADALRQLQALGASQAGDRLETAKAFRSILDGRKAALDRLFTAEQMTKYTATNQKDAASLMTLSLDQRLTPPLTNDQMKNTDKVNLIYIQKVTAALALSDKEAAVQAIKTAQSEYDSALLKILTPDQGKQYQALIAGGAGGAETQPTQ